MCEVMWPQVYPCVTLRCTHARHMYSSCMLIHDAMQLLGVFMCDII